MSLGGPGADQNKGLEDPQGHELEKPATALQLQSRAQARERLVRTASRGHRRLLCFYKLCKLALHNGGTWEP